MADPGVRDLPFDVFLSHNSSDKPAVRALAALLEERGLRVWLDEQQLEAGTPWQPHLEAAIRQSKAGAVLIGGNGFGPWQDMEMQVLLNSAATEHKPLIPVLLPAAPAKPDLPAFLSLFTWVDFRQGFSEEPLARLISAITGGKPAPRPAPYPARGLEIAPTHLRHGAEHLFGRDDELARLDAAWHDPKTHVVTIVAWGGVGKTALALDWMARLAADGWRGAQRVFDWSFYSQGTREQGAASADLFVNNALRFFGDPDPVQGSPWDKGERLARLVAERKTLLVLDGLEPLQHPPGPYGGGLKDPALSCLLKGLAQHNPGLCLVTTRESVADLAPFRQATAPEWRLDRLSEAAGAALLHRLGANRVGQIEIPPDDAELCQVSREVQGHALTLQFLGRYLAKAHQGDVRRRDRVRFEKADAETQGGHAFKVMAAYERWLASSGEAGQRSLAVWRLMGLFDRPADPGCLAAVCQPPAIPGLTEPLVGLAEEDWNLAIANLEEADLLGASSYEPRRVRGFGKDQVRWSGYEGTASGEVAEFDPPRSPGPAAGGRSLEAHPLVREHFAAQLRRASLASWQEAHRRLYGYLSGSVPYWPEGFEGLQPLYQAVVHGCQAGLHQEACDEVYHDRIQRGGEAYSTRKLGAVGADLGAVACFFDRPWTTAAPSLSEPAQSWLLNEAAFRLRALGRLQEALEPMRAGLKMVVAQEDWNNAARYASNLSELELTLGDVPGAVRDAQQSVDLADRSGDAFQKMGKHTTLADALHQAGRQGEALDLFRQAEAMQAARQPQYPLLYSVQGFQYCDLLLSEAERAAWGLSQFSRRGLSQFSRRGLSQFSQSENGTVPLSTTKNAPIPLPPAALADKQPVPPGENGTVPLGTTENAPIPLGTTENAPIPLPPAALADKQPVPPGENGTVPLPEPPAPSPPTHLPRRGEGSCGSTHLPQRGEGSSEAAVQGEPNAVADAALLARCREVEQRAAQTLKVASEQNWLLDIALDHLTLGRAALYRAVLNVPAGAGPGEPETGVASDSKPGEAETALASDSKPGGCNPWALRGSPGRPGAGPEKAEALQTARRELAAAVDGLRRAGTTHHLPLGLLSRAWLRGLEGDGAGARADLDEAGQIAQRGAMRLHMADVHLYRARLFRAGPDRAAALADVAEARKLIEQHGYRRRDPELADVEAALGVADP